jgi:hypothetical protein
MMQECLIWEQSTRSNGYGQTFVDGKNRAAHIVAWEALYGPVPKGMYLDHICHNQDAKAGKCEGKECSHRACYNPNHLRVVTPSENTRSGLWGIDTKAECPQGHDYTNPNNIMIRANGRRECAQCNRTRSRKVWATRVKKGVN